MHTKFLYLSYLQVDIVKKRTFLQCKENPQIQYNITIKCIRYHEKISCQV